MSKHSHSFPRMTYFLGVQSRGTKWPEIIGLWHIFALRKKKCIVMPLFSMNKWGLNGETSKKAWGLFFIIHPLLKHRNVLFIPLSSMHVCSFARKFVFFSSVAIILRHVDFRFLHASMEWCSNLLPFSRWPTPFLSSSAVVLGGDQWWAWHRPNRHIPRRQRPPARQDQRILQRGHR